MSWGPDFGGPINHFDIRNITVGTGGFRVVRPLRSALAGVCDFTGAYGSGANATLPEA